MNSWSIKLFAFVSLAIMSVKTIAQECVDKTADIDRMYCIQNTDDIITYSNFCYSAISYKGEKIVISYSLPVQHTESLTVTANNSNEQTALDEEFCSNKGIANFLLQKLGYMPAITREELSIESQNETTESTKSIFVQSTMNDNVAFSYYVEVLNSRHFTRIYSVCNMVRKTEVIMPKDSTELEQILIEHFTPSGVEEFIKRVSKMTKLPKYETLVDF